MTTPHEDVKRLLQEMLLEDKCEVCGSTTGIQARVVPGSKTYTARSPGHLCQRCYDEIASMKRGVAAKTTDGPSGTASATPGGNPSVTSKFTDRGVMDVIDRVIGGRISLYKNIPGGFEAIVYGMVPKITNTPFSSGKIDGTMKVELGILSITDNAGNKIIFFDDVTDEVQLERALNNPVDWEIK